MSYPFKNIEPKWQNYWESHKTFKTTEDKRGAMSLTCSLTRAEPDFT